MMISTTLARRDMHRKKNLCTSPNLHGNGQLGEHMFGKSHTLGRVPPDVALVEREKLLGCLSLHHLPATLSWNWF